MAWNKCDVCGKYIAYSDFEHGAVRRMVTPSSDYSSEIWDTKCVFCANPVINIPGDVKLSKEMFTPGNIVQLPNSHLTHSPN